MAEKQEMEDRPEFDPVPRNLKIKTADGVSEVNMITEHNDPNKNSIDKSQKTLMKRKGLAMVGSKGHSFPMIEQDPVEMQKKKLMEQQGLAKPEPNRGGVPEKVLVNNPNNPQPMNKVSANANSREQMFGKMAMDAGQPFQDQATTTPPAPMFPNQQVSFGMYDGPGSQETPKLGRMSMNMYDGLNLTEKQENNLNPNLKAAIEAKEAEGTAMYDGPSIDKKKETKGEDKRTLPMTAAQKKKYEEAVQSYKDSTAEWIGGKGPQPKVPNYDSFKVDKAPGMHEQHTQISKANVNAAMRDDAAHASYLKRDITYDNRHGGSKKQMTADEKHISKLAGDIKYDVKKKRKYDNL